MSTPAEDQQPAQPAASAMTDNDRAIALLVQDDINVDDEEQDDVLEGLRDMAEQEHIDRQNYDNYDDDESMTGLLVPRERNRNCPCDEPAPWKNAKGEYWCDECGKPCRAQTLAAILQTGKAMVITARMSARAQRSWPPDPPGGASSSASSPQVQPAIVEIPPLPRSPSPEIVEVRIPDNKRKVEQLGPPLVAKSAVKKEKLQVASFAEQRWQDVAIGSHFPKDGCYINPALALIEGSAAYVYQESQPWVCPEQHLLEMKGYFDQGPIGEFEWAKAGLRADKFFKLYPSYQAWQTKYVPAEDVPQQVTVERDPVSRLEMFMVPLVLGSVSSFPGKETMNVRPVYLAYNDDVVYRNRADLPRGNANVAWVVPQISVETPYQQLAAQYPPVQVAFHDVLLGRIVDMKEGQYSYLTSFYRRFSARMAQRLVSVHAIDDNDVYNIRAGTHVGDSHGQAKDLKAALRHDGLCIYAPDFLTAVLQQDVERLVHTSVEPSKRMLKMTCGTAAELIGRVALYGAVNPFSTAAEAAAEFGLSERQIQMLAMQLDFVWPTQHERYDVARYVIATMLCCYDTTRTAVQLQQAVERVQNISVTLDEASAILIRTVLQVVGNSKLRTVLTPQWRQQRKPEVIAARNEMLRAPERVTETYRNFWSTYVHDRFDRELLDRILPPQMPSYWRVRNVAGRCQAFIDTILAEKKPYNGMRPPELYLDANGDEVLAVSWVFPFDAEGSSLVAEPLRGYVGPAMYQVGNSQQRWIAPGVQVGRENMAYFIPPIVMPRPNHTLYECRMLKTVENIRRMHGLSANSDRRAISGFEPLPYETHTYDDSRDYYNNDNDYSLPHEPQFTMPLRGVPYLELRALGTVAKIPGRKGGVMEEKPRFQKEKGSWKGHSELQRRSAVMRRTGTSAPAVQIIKGEWGQ